MQQETKKPKLCGGIVTETGYSCVLHDGHGGLCWGGNDDEN